MRVLQIINSLSLAGAETLVKELSLRLQRRGILTHVYMLHRSNSPLEQDLDRASIALFGPTGLSIYSPAQVWALTRFLSSHHYDLLHVHLFPAQLWAALAAKRLPRRVQMVTTEHSTHNRRRRWYFRLLDHLMYRQYVRIVCISEATEQALLFWMPSLAGLTQVIPNGIDIERFAMSRSCNKKTLLGISDDCPLVVSVGRFELLKDQSTLLRAVSRLEGVHVALVGDGPLREELVSLTHRLGITGRVHFLGRRTDIPKILKTADIYVQPSRWEGFGIAALEAMSAGLPVVASNVPGLADVVGDAGMLFQPGDIDALTSHLRLLLDNPSLRMKLGEQARSRAAKYGIETTVEQYVELYRRT